MKRALLFQRSPDLSRNVLNMAQIKFAAPQARSADTYKGNIRREHGGNGIRSRMQPARLIRRRDQFFHPRLDDRASARVEHFDLRLADVNARDLVAHVRKTRGAHRTNIAQAKQTD